jgi:hypothetical protein
VSDLSNETSPAATAEPDTSREPAPDAGSRPQYETADPAEQGYGEYAETDAQVQARIASQDELPAREESRHVTWGDNPDYYDETNLGADYDGDANAFLAGENELPTPQESRARTWGDSPDYYDETDLAFEYDGDIGTLTTEEDSPAAQPAPASSETADTHAEPAAPPEDTADSRARDADYRHQDAASTADEQPDQGGSDQAATRPGLAPEAQDTAGTDTNAQASEPDDAESSAGDGEVLSPEADRFKALETEHDAARQKIADLEAELKAVKDKQAARFDRIEQLLASTDRQPTGTDAPEHGADQPGATRDPDAKSPLLAENKNPDEFIDAEKAEQAEHPRWRSAVSSENVGAAGALVGAADTVAQFTMHATPEGVAGLGGNGSRTGLAGSCEI